MSKSTLSIMNLKSRKAFTLLELLATIALVSVLLGGLVVPAMRSSIDSSNNTDAVRRAHLINFAKSEYSLENPNDSTWGTLTNSERYQTLRSINPLLEDSLSDFAPNGYSYTIGGLSEKVALFRNGSQISY